MGQLRRTAAAERYSREIAIVAVVWLRDVHIGYAANTVYRRR